MSGACVSAAFAQKRVALVIGNAAYQNESALKNPVNDANAIADTLRRDLGFEVELHTNLRRDALQKLIGQFERKAAGADAVVFYFSGHGMQDSKRQNMLLPIDAKIADEDDVSVHGIAAERFIEVIEAARPRAAMVILDACRDNPYVRATKSVNKGLARVRDTNGLVVAYATQEGKTAKDGSGTLSPYAQHLRDNLRRKDVPILSMLDSVAEGVERDTGNAQQPTRSGNLRVNVYLVNPSITVNNNASTVSRTDPDEEAFKAALSVDIADGYEQYLKDFPSGRNASAAKIKLAAARKRDVRPADATPSSFSALPVSPPRRSWAPSRPVSIIVPFAPGGAVDITARKLAAILAPQFNQPVIIVNAAGSGGTIGAAKAANAQNDGHTLLLHNTSVATSTGIYLKPGLDPARDLVPIGAVTFDPLILVSSPSNPAASLPALFSAIRASGGKMTFASSGMGSSSHLCGAVLSKGLLVDVPHIPYRGLGPAITDLMGGQTDIMCVQASSIRDTVRQNKVKAYGVFSKRTPEEMPRIERVSDYLAGVEMSDWTMLFAPRDTPADIVDSLASALQTALKNSDLISGLKQVGVEVAAADVQSPAGAKALLATETRKRMTLLKDAGVNPE